MENALVHELDEQIRRGDKLGQLIAKKNELLRQLLQVEKEIAEIFEFVRLSPQRIQETTAPAKVESAESKKRGRKPKGEFSLANMILQLVSANEKGLTMSEITSGLFQNGFKTESAEPARLISATLSNMKSKGLLSKNDENRFVIS
jgi:hypothetical protein